MYQFRKGWNIRSVWITIFVGVLLSITVAYLNYYLEKGKTAAEFSREAENKFSALKRQIEVDLSILHPTVGFFNSSDFVNREEFHTFWQSAKIKKSSMKAISWIPRVGISFRVKFEDEAKSSGFPDFSFTEQQKGKLVTAATREEYFPVYYIEPLKDNQAALGFDLASNPIRRAMLIQSRDNGEITASETIILVQDAEKKRFSFLVVAPIFQGATNSITSRRNNLQGYISAVFDVDNIVTMALSQLNTGTFNIQMHLFDGDKLVYPSQTEHRDQEYYEMEVMEAGLHVEKKINVAGLRWKVQLLPSHRHWESRGYPIGTLIELVVGLVLTIFIALYFRNTHLHTREVENQVTDRTAQLQASEAKSEAVISKSVIPIITINEERLIQTFNPAAEEMFGYSAEELIGQNVRLLMPEPYRSNHDSYVRRYLQTGEKKILGVNRREVKGCRKNGEIFPMHLSVGEAWVDGRVFIGMALDISDLKQAEDELRKHRDNLAQLVEERTYELEMAKEAAERANQAKSVFLANMSHEIRTPMNAVLGFIQITLESQDLSGEIRKYQETAYTSAQNLLTIINDILDANKLESGKLVLEKTCLNLPNTVKNSIKILDSQAREKNSTLNFHFSTNLSHCYVGDPTRLSQVMLNLVGNAIKFTKEGNITIAVKGSDQGKDLLHFSVADTGIGMTPEQAENIFSPFNQADVSTARRYGGTGLGLTISKQIIELMGGRIWVESEFGNGSIFHFTVQLPETLCTAGCINQGLTMEAPVLQSPRRFQILLAEDVPENAKLAQLRLEQLGHTVKHVWNGRETVEMYNTALFDVILMDVMMPEMDGIEATQRIRRIEIEKESNKRVTIIALTANIMREDIGTYLNAGMDTVIGKPIIWEELFSTMDKIVPESFGTLNEDIIVDYLEKPEIDLTPLAGVVDIAAGLATWQNSLVFIESIIGFIDKHSDDADKIQQLLNEQNIKEVKMITHALKGVAGNLSLVDVAGLTTEIDDLLEAGNNKHAEKLIPSLHEALKNIGELVGLLKIPMLNNIDIPTREFDSQKAGRLIQELLDRLDEDNPAVVEPVLDKLAEYVCQSDMSGVRQAIDNFDFDQAKSQAQILAEKLSLQIEG